MTAPRGIPTRTRLVGLAVAGLVLATAGACSDSGPAGVGSPVAAAHSHVSPPDTADSLLYVVEGVTGTLTPGRDRVGTLTLERVGDVRWFSDRPRRDAGSTTVADALRTFGWHRDGDDLGSDPPNATLVRVGPDDRSTVLELSSARVDGSRVTFDVRFVSGRPRGQVTLADPALFIDSAGLQPFDVDTRLFPWLSVTTQVRAFPDTGDDNELQVTFNGPNGRFGWPVVLDPQQAQLGRQTFQSGEQVLQLTALTMSPATPDQPGALYATGTVTDQYGAGIAPFNQVIATWTSTGPMPGG